MIPRPLDRVGLCVCGLSVALHFDGENRKVSCAAAAALMGERNARELARQQMQGIGVFDPRWIALDTVSGRSI